MAKINREQLNSIGRVAKEGGKYLLYGLAAVLTYANLINSTSDFVRYSDNTDFSDADFGDAVKAIMDSDMSSYHKDQAISILVRDGDSGLYKAIMAIAKSNMSDYHKVESIKKLCAKTE